MSLAFLAKKSWHTSNLRNVEKVWIAEQKHAAEEKKLEELKKNYEEERQMQELRKLQAAHGKKTATVERLDWMYQGPMASSSATEKSSEEYLLGKEYTPEVTGSDARKLGDTAYGALALSKAALPANDAFSRLNEDPMMLIRSQQKRAHEDILKNPVKMKKIKGQVEKILKDKKNKKKAKKQAKKERKHAKSGKSTSSTRDRSGSEDSDRPVNAESRERNRSPSADKQSRGNHADHDDRKPRSVERETKRRYESSPSRSRSRSRDVGRRGARDRSRSREATRNHPRPESRSRRHSRSASRSRQGRRHRSHSHSRSRSRSRDSFGRSARRSTSPISSSRHYRASDSRRPTQEYGSRGGSSRRSPPRRSGGRSRTPEERRPRSDDRDRTRRRSRDRDERNVEEIRVARSRRSHSNERPGDPRRRDKSPLRREYVVNKPDDGGKYGLIRQEGAVECKEVDRTTLGPNTKFVEKAREKKRHDEDELKRKLAKTPHGGSTRSHEEMVKQAAQMAEDAKAREVFLAKRAAEKSVKLDEAEAKLSEDPHFLKQLQNAAYIKDDSSMEDRLRRNSHYIQRRTDVGNFLSKD